MKKIDFLLGANGIKGEDPPCYPKERETTDAWKKNGFDYEYCGSTSHE